MRLVKQEQGGGHARPFEPGQHQNRRSVCEFQPQLQKQTVSQCESSLQIIIYQVPGTRPVPSVDSAAVPQSDSTFSVLPPPEQGGVEEGSVGTDGSAVAPLVSLSSSAALVVNQCWTSSADKPLDRTRSCNCREETSSILLTHEETPTARVPWSREKTQNLHPQDTTGTSPLWTSFLTSTHTWGQW